LNVSQAKEKIIEEFKGESFTQDIIDFLNTSQRGIIGK
ncbi:MAG: acyl-[acyl-carrier-protein]--UDP-N-acetylglucosamine O-acyltransferase, partial [Ignavibacteriales bacterium]